MSNEKTLRTIFDKLKGFLLENPIGLALTAKKASIELNSRLNGKRIRRTIQYFKNGRNIQVFCEKGKNWWKNLRNGAPVDVIIKGERFHGWAEVIEEKQKISQYWSDLAHSISTRISKLSTTGQQDNGSFGVDEKQLNNLVLITVQIP